MIDDIRTATARALWDDGASNYQDVMEPVLREPHLAVGPLAGDVRGLDMQDLGCGTGAVSELLGPAGARVTAVHLAPHMVAVVRVRRAGVPGVVGIDEMVPRSSTSLMPPPTSWRPRPVSCAAPITPLRLPGCTACCGRADGW